MQTLKYLYTATYRDGHIYQQNAEDKSVIEPDKRSCFFDLEQADENHKDNIAIFTLKGDGHTYSVDLRDGSFAINGISFFMHEENDLLKDFRLIFFRRHTHTILQTKTEDKELTHHIVYRVGWQCTVNGKNYQEVMQFA